MLKSITGVYIGGIAAVVFADYICNFFLCVLFLMGGLFCGKGVGRCGRYSFVIGWWLSGAGGCCAQRKADGTPTHHKWA